jgi:hypothetical protein
MEEQKTQKAMDLSLEEIKQIKQALKEKVTSRAQQGSHERGDARRATRVSEG